MSRPSLIRLLCGLGLLAGVALSPRLWGLGPRAFPRVPVAGPALPAAAEAAAALLMAGGLVASAWRPRLRWAAGAAALLLLWTDQMRWQPWAWEYLLVGVLAGGERLAARLIVGGVIAWAGLWKLGPLFATRVVPWLGAPLPPGLRWTVLAVPYVEMLVGSAVMAGWRPARWGLLGMHAAALALLVPRGWNTVVWPWQVAAIAIGWAALGGGKGAAAARWRGFRAAAPPLPPPAVPAVPVPSPLDTQPVPAALAPSPPDAPPVPPSIGPAPPELPQSPRPPAPSRRPAPGPWVAAGLALLLPAFWPLGWVNSYLAWRLYTGDETDADLEQWAFQDLNVPLSPAAWRIGARPAGQRSPDAPEDGE